VSRVARGSSSDTCLSTVDTVDLITVDPLEGPGKHSSSMENPSDPSTSQEPASLVLRLAGPSTTKAG
jgi:hypothetical protein